MLCQIVSVNEAIKQKKNKKARECTKSDKSKFPDKNKSNDETRYKSCQGLNNTEQV
jgi:hypothetical protein